MALASHHGDPGSIPGGLTPGYSHVGIVLGDAAYRRLSPRTPVSPAFAFQRCSILGLSLHVTSGDDGDLRAGEPSITDALPISHGMRRRLGYNYGCFRRLPALQQGSLTRLDPVHTIVYIRHMQVVFEVSVSPPTNANRVRFPAGSHPDIRMWELCRMMPLVDGFSLGSPVPAVLAFRCCSIFTSVTLIGFQGLDVKRRPNLFTHSLEKKKSVCDYVRYMAMSFKRIPGKVIELDIRQLLRTQINESEGDLLQFNVTDFDIIRFGTNINASAHRNRQIFSEIIRPLPKLPPVASEPSPDTRACDNGDGAGKRVAHVLRPWFDSRTPAHEVRRGGEEATIQKSTVVTAEEVEGCASTRSDPVYTFVYITHAKCPVAPASSAIRDRMILVPNQDPV
ncbi:hypothetical protein PR048_012397 [Dryococelus australis]|uniref:Uncharacterized protein n=1 Tax=Dryococelus australis TaxID=614101 RepID=A0ABQ9HP97_9NEOP|nr:hypothetical protein PR048_012397 [Dryococelus australis]